MKKLIAILFLAIICLTILPGDANLWNATYDQLTDSEDHEKANKEDKKEAKEFTLNTPKKLYAAPSLIYRHKVHEIFILPQPLLNIQTPPPDRTC